jgi:hypothetical protein
LAVCADEPDTRDLIVVQGASTTSSWSKPIVLAPLRERTPTTFSATFWTRTSLPTADSPWKSSRSIVLPRRQTLLAFRTSRSLKGSPESRSDQSRTSRNAGVVP